jgi:hypothetical protein
VSAGIFQRAVVDESGMIRAQVGIHNRSENGHSAWDTVIPPITATTKTRRNLHSVERNNFPLFVTSITTICKSVSVFRVVLVYQTPSPPTNMC